MKWKPSRRTLLLIAGILLLGNVVYVGYRNSAPDAAAIVVRMDNDFSGAREKAGLTRKSLFR